MRIVEVLMIFMIAASIASVATGKPLPKNVLLRIVAKKGGLVDAGPGKHKFKSKNIAKWSVTGADRCKKNKFLITTGTVSENRKDKLEVLDGSGKSGSIAKVLSQSKSWSLSLWVKLYKYEPYGVVMSDKAKAPVYLSIDGHGYMAYALGAGKHDKKASNMRLPLNQWVHCEWAVKDRHIKTYVNGKATNLAHSNTVWPTPDGKLTFFGSPRYGAGAYLLHGQFDLITLEVGAARQFTKHGPCLKPTTPKPTKKPTKPKTTDKPSKPTPGAVELLKKMKSKDLSKYGGLTIKKDSALIAMGSKKDINIYRNGPRQLVVDANTVTRDLHVLGNIMINGRVLQSIIKAEVDKAVAPLKMKIAQLSAKPKTTKPKPTKPSPPKKISSQVFSCQKKLLKIKAPAKAKWVAFTLLGGSGGLNYVGNPGHKYAAKAGYGGTVKGTFKAVKGGGEVQVYVGCQGGNGNSCGSGGCKGGGGGGASALYVTTAKGPVLLAVAGAGGGSAGANDQGYTHEDHGHGGGGGGLTGGQGGDDGCGCGHGGSHSGTKCGGGGRGGSTKGNGGNGGSPGGGNRGEPKGSAGKFKNGGNCGGKSGCKTSGGWGWGTGGCGCQKPGDGGGGGGGAGRYGGGGGGSGCHGTGGGGGSSYCDAKVQKCSLQSGSYGYKPSSGKITLEWWG